MQERLVNELSKYANFSELQIREILSAFKEVIWNKNDLIIKQGAIFNSICFITEGVIRHYTINKAGEPFTCDFSLPGQWLTDIQSFSEKIPTNYFYQAIQPTKLFVITHQALMELYNSDPIFERCSRRIIEQTLLRISSRTEVLLHLSPEQRYLKLRKEQPELIQQVPSKYIANYLGLTPESLSRIKARSRKK